MANNLNDVGGPFERAALRTQRGVRGAQRFTGPAGREEGAFTRGLEQLGEDVIPQTPLDYAMLFAGGVPGRLGKAALLGLAGALHSSQARAGPGTAVAEKLLPTLARIGEGTAFRAPDLPRPSLLVPQRDIVRVPGIVSPTVMPSAFERSLFDYSKLHEVPDVPQFGLPRYVPARGVPEQFTKLDTPENVARVNAMVEQGIKRGGLRWYNTMPLREGWVGELGAEAAIPRYQRFMNLEGATSPRTPVPQNIGQGSYYQMLAEQGLPLPQPFWKIDPKTGKGNWSLSEGELPEGYGSLAQAGNALNARMVLAEAGWPQSILFQKPKPPSYTQNLLGNYDPITGDIHFTGMWGARHPETGKILQEPGTGYGFMENMSQREARKMGIAPAQWQSSGWITQASQGATPETAAEYSKPFLQLLEDRVKDAARTYGWMPEQTLRQFYRGQIPIALGAGGVPVLMSATPQDQGSGL